MKIPQGRPIETCGVNVYHFHLYKRTGKVDFLDDVLDSANKTFSFGSDVLAEGVLHMLV